MYVHVYEHHQGVLLRSQCRVVVWRALLKQHLVFTHHPKNKLCARKHICGHTKFSTYLHVYMHNYKHICTYMQIHTRTSMNKITCR